MARRSRRLEPALAPGLVGARMAIGFPVAPASATHAFAALARARGATIVEGVDAQVARDGRAAMGVVVDGAVREAGAVVVAAGPWTPALVDPSGTWRPIRPYWGVIVELELGDDAPRHVLEEADVEDATAPGAPREADGSVGFSLVTADGRSSLGSTFLPAEPDPRDLRGPPARARRPLRAHDRRRAARRACGRAPDRSRSTAGHSSAPSRASSGCSSPRATVRGGSRRGRRRQRTSRRSCSASPTRGRAAVAAATDAARFGAPPSA